MGMYGCGLYIDGLSQGLSHWTDNWPLFSTYTPLTYTQAHSLEHITEDSGSIDLSDRVNALQLFYLSAGACLGRRGVHYVCKHLCIGVPGPCLLSDSAGVPFGGWVGAIVHWEGVWGGRWEVGEQEDPCWGWSVGWDWWCRASSPGALGASHLSLSCLWSCRGGQGSGLKHGLTLSCF